MMILIIIIIIIIIILLENIPLFLKYNIKINYIISALNEEEEEEEEEDDDDSGFEKYIFVILKEMKYIFHLMIALSGGN